MKEKANCGTTDAIENAFYIDFAPKNVVQIVRSDASAKQSLLNKKSCEGEVYCKPGTHPRPLYQLTT